MSDRSHQIPLSRSDIVSGRSRLQRLLRLGSMTAGLLAAFACGNPGVAAETSEVRIIRQFGLGYLPLIVADHEKLIQKHAAQEGIAALRVVWSRVGGGAAANDALLSGSADYIAAGVGPLLTLWDRTRGHLGVRGVVSLDASALFLNTRGNARSLAELTPADRIALPSVKVSHQAILLQMAAEKLFGVGQQFRLDAQTVTMAHPEAAALLLSGRTEITTHFANPPFEFEELNDPSVHLLLSSDDVLGGPGTVTSLFTTAKFRDDNPKVYRAVFEAVVEAHRMIRDDRARVAQIYVEAEGAKVSARTVETWLANPALRYSETPFGTHQFAAFMYRTGALKTMPVTWHDYFFPEVFDRPGS